MNEKQLEDRAIVTDNGRIRGADDLEDPVVTPDADATAPGGEGISLSRRLLRPRTILSFVLAAAIVLFALSRFNLDLGAVLREMSHASPWYLAAAFVVYYASFVVRGIRWRLLLENAGVEPAPGRHLPAVPSLMTIILLSWLANCLVPAKLGDAYRGYLLKQRSGASFGSALGTVFAERLADLMMLTVCLVGSGLIVFHGHVPSRFSNWIILAVALGLGLVLGLIVVYRFRLVLRGFVPYRVRHHYVRLEEGALGAFGRLPALISLTLVVWFTEGLRLFLVSQSVHSGIAFSSALFVALFASLLTAIPITPAGLGFVEFGVVGALTLLGTSDQTAASITFLDRIINYWSIILIGAIVAAIARWVWRRAA